jgi:hypothetical protein
MSELQNVVPLRSVDHLAREVVRKWTLTENVLEKYKSTRLDLARSLLELHDCITNGDAGDQAAIDWWGWFDDNIGRSRDYAEKLLALARSDDPAAKYEEQKKADRESKANEKALRVATIRRGLEAAAGATTDRISRKNNQAQSSDYLKIVPSSTPESLSQADRDEVQAVIEIIKKWRRPQLRYFVAQFKRVYREIF